MASPGTSPFGSTRSPPAWRSRAVKRPAPILSSTATAGTLSDICSALRTATVPWKLRSKFSGA
jgi:hypothetical protein